MRTPIFYILSLQVLLGRDGPHTKPSGFLFGRDVLKQDWEYFSKYEPAPVAHGEEMRIWASAPFPTAMDLFDVLEVRAGTELWRAAPGQKGKPRGSAQPPFMFAGIMLSQIQPERGKRRFALLLSSTHEFYLCPFSSEHLASTAEAVTFREQDAHTEILDEIKSACEIVASRLASTLIGTAKVPVLVPAAPPSHKESDDDSDDGMAEDDKLDDGNADDSKEHNAPRRSTRHGHCV